MNQYFQLHLELQMDQEHLPILQKYGKVKNSISRDIIVPASIPLYGLHFAIQKCFGWQNSHLHSFHFPKDLTRQITNNSYKGWEELCGLYFRFPYGDDDASFEDLYWYDNYDGKMNYNTYLRRKYNPPYALYKGTLEHYLICKMNTKEFEENNPIVSVHPIKNGYPYLGGEVVEKKLEETELYQLQEVVFGSYDDLLERLPLQQVLTLKRQKNWRKDLTELVNHSIENSKEYHQLLLEISEERKAIEEDQQMDPNLKKGLLLNQYIRLVLIYGSTDYQVIPISNELIYEYDYGDDWQVNIRLDHIYELNEGIVIDENGGIVEDEAIITAMNKEKSTCLAADGLNVLDDVGNVGGYCAMLQALNKEDGSDYGFEDVESTRAWARSQGWTGRSIKPKNIL